MKPIEKDDLGKRKTVGGVGAMSMTSTRVYILAIVGVFTISIVLLTLLEVWTGVHRGTGRGLISSYGAGKNDDRSTCKYGGRALVYNKAPKTASSFIQGVIINWTERENRPLYQCYRPPLLTLANIRSCLPAEPDPCGVFSCHVFLEPYTSRLFAQFFPNHLLATSTRYPGHRIVSMFLFSRGMRDDDPRVPYGLARFLEGWNPWTLFNYHTGLSRSGACPLSRDEQLVVYAVATRFDVIIDANARAASNVILKHHGLFTLPSVAVEDRNKERGAVRVNMTDDLLSALRNVACVEDELHRALQFRMARLYEDASGKQCIYDQSMPKPDTCIEHEERDSLKNYWRY